MSIILKGLHNWYQQISAAPLFTFNEILVVSKLEIEEQDLKLLLNYFNDVMQILIKIQKLFDSSETKRRISQTRSSPLWLLPTLGVIEDNNDSDLESIVSCHVDFGSFWRQSGSGILFYWVFGYFNKRVIWNFWWCALFYTTMYIPKEVNLQECQWFCPFFN